MNLYGVAIQYGDDTFALHDRCYRELQANLDAAGIDASVLTAMGPATADPAMPCASVPCGRPLGDDV